MWAGWVSDETALSEEKVESQLHFAAGNLKENGSWHALGEVSVEEATLSESHVLDTV